jgi:hypothetical protein
MGNANKIGKAVPVQATAIGHTHAHKHFLFAELPKLALYNMKKW